MQKLKSIYADWGEDFDVDEWASEQAEKRKRRVRDRLRHPMYRLITVAKFRIAESTRLKGEKIAELVEQCHQNKVSVEALLEWAWKNDQNKDLRRELSQAGQADQSRFDDKRRQVGDKVYRQVHGWFRRRGWRMPRPPEDWRRKVIN